ncbi:hypothetical protein GC176_26875 [bacterium]|nr:hypothetical protein [bacterium]
MPLHPHSNATFLDTLVRAGMWIGGLFLVFMLGVAAMHLRIMPSFVLEAIEVADDWDAITKDDIQQAELDIIDKRPRNKNPVSRAKVKVWDKTLAYNGYTVVNVRNEDKVYLVDMEGKVIHAWDAVPRSTLKGADKDSEEIKLRLRNSFSQLFPNGDLLVISVMRGKTPYGHSLIKMDKDSNVLWSFDSFQMHHAVYVDKENGNIYALGHDFVKRTINLAPHMPESTLDDLVMILSPNGKLLESISVFDAFMGTPFEGFLYNEIKDKAQWDRLHTNSIMKLEPEMAMHFPMLKAGQILISVRNMDAIAALDPETQKIVWAMKGPWDAQHDAQFLDNGSILLFDNLGHSFSGKTYSRVLEFSPGTMAVPWYYAGGPGVKMFTSTHGSAERLKNGNTLITESNDGRIIEVTKEGKIVWEYVLPGERIGDLSPSTIYHARRFSKNELTFLAPEKQ